MNAKNLIVRAEEQKKEYTIQKALILYPQINPWGWHLGFKTGWTHVHNSDYIGAVKEYDRPNYPARIYLPK